MKRPLMIKGNPLKINGNIVNIAEDRPPLPLGKSLDPKLGMGTYSVGATSEGRSSRAKGRSR